VGVDDGGPKQAGDTNVHAALLRHGALGYVNKTTVRVETKEVS